MKNISKRNTMIVEMKNDGITQEEIAKKFGITRQRVQQIEASLGLDRKKVLVILSIKCKKCKKTFKSKVAARKYCSRACSSTCRKIVRTPAQMEEYKEAIRAQKRERARDYYRKVLIKK